MLKFLLVFFSCFLFSCDYIKKLIGKDSKKTETSVVEESSINTNIILSRESNIKFLEENKNKEGVKTTASGLQYKIIKEGKGKMPNARDNVEVHYKGTLINGEEFDSSYKRDRTATFGLHQVIPGWTEGLQLMKEGSVFEFYIPSRMAYGERALPGIPAGSTLIFKVELIKVL